MRLCCKEWKKEVDSCALYALKSKANDIKFLTGDIVVNNQNPCFRLFWLISFIKYFEYYWGPPFCPRMDCKIMHVNSEEWTAPDDRDQISTFILTEEHFTSSCN